MPQKQTRGFRPKLKQQRHQTIICYLTFGFQVSCFYRSVNLVIITMLIAQQQQQQSSSLRQSLATIIAESTITSSLLLHLYPTLFTCMQPLLLILQAIHTWSIRLISVILYFSNNSKTIRNFTFNKISKIFCIYALVIFEEIFISGQQKC